MLDRLAERLRRRVEGAEEALDLALVQPLRAEERQQRPRVGGLLRPEATETAAGEGGAESAAACVRDRAEAGRPMGDAHADEAARLALRADARRRDLRLASVQERRHDLEELVLVHRAAAQLEVDGD